MQATASLTFCTIAARPLLRRLIRVETKMKSEELDALFQPVAKRLHANHMEALGIADTQRLALAYNGAKYGAQDAWRRELYQKQFSALLDENGGCSRPRIKLNDGWALDTSMSLPHLDRVLEQSEELIAERAGTRTSKTGAYRSYFQDVWTPADCERFPAFLDFATSSDLIASVGDYLQCIPALTTTLPSGIRFVESNTQYDDQPGKFRDSQLYHIDYYSLPNVYVLVLLRDTTIESGPWTFLPKSVSQVAAKKLNNWGRGVGYRFTDEQVYGAIDKKHEIQFIGPRGSVLFIESSGCMHFGSRNSVVPRFQLMLGYSGAIRTDLSEVIMTPKVYPIRPDDSRLRKMVLEKNLLPCW
jgi:hypothetical protein